MTKNDTAKDRKENEVPRKLSLFGFPKDVTTDQIMSFLVVPQSCCGKWGLSDPQKNRQTSSVILQFMPRTLTKQEYKTLCSFLKKTRFNNEYIISVGPYKESKGTNKDNINMDMFARSFWRFVTVDQETLLCDRDLVTSYFGKFCMKEEPSIVNNPRKLKLKEISTMTRMRQLKLVKSSRANNYSVLIMFCNPDDLKFPNSEEQAAAKEKLQSDLDNARSNKNDVCISELPDRITGSIGETETIRFNIDIVDPKQLINLELRGSHASNFCITTTLPFDDDTAAPAVFLTVVPRKIGVMRAKLFFFFEDFVIARTITMSCGSAEMNSVLQPTSPYKRKKRTNTEQTKKELIRAPKHASNSSAGNPFKNLPQYTIPTSISECLRNDWYDFEMEATGWQNAATHDSLEGYGNYWKHMLWAEEYQIKRDIQLYDMENVRLRKDGRHFLLRVPGLAEGRPSVLRGDFVNISLGTRLYQGRVMCIRQLEVVLDLHSNFSREYNPGLDSVSVRFTFSRMSLRTSHKACEGFAEEQMGALMLTPTEENVVAMRERAGSRRDNTVTIAPWANRNLNPEQQVAVRRIVNGTFRPLPYIIFGPPGTGKTTTVVETIYQLAKKGKRILLVAPSNDAADILVERLASYFPPSELRRILAYSRTIESLPASIRAYASDSLEHIEQASEILCSQIIVSTVNLAARFSFWGIPRGHFEVLCVDEAGHSTEPEVIAVASSLMHLKENPSTTSVTTNIGQVILAGDPKQLGPISTSTVCLKYGLSVSYMERLSDRSVYQANNEGQYPEELMTKLIRNYRSHSAILKLPNQMFYEESLKCCGDMMVTSNLVRWEHLPKPGFPVIFHAMDGDNLREGNSPSWFNPEEAQQVVEYARLLMHDTRPDLQADEIGIITPYARQAQKIRLALKTQNMDDIKVGSVETFQGQERRVIIISTVRAQRDQVSSDIRYNLGFVANPKRFNVAVTRAKALLIVIGSPSVLAMDQEQWLPFMTYCHKNGAWSGDDWDPSTAVVEDEESFDESSSSTSSDDFDIIDNPSKKATQEGFVVIGREE